MFSFKELEIEKLIPQHVTHIILSSLAFASIHIKYHVWISFYYK